ncbi:hypothetical protein GCM10007036_23920 [Alsobacter metallidurans]|uniref:Uncharacterized protein n=2 Tax=Alsobacter metallidurans TaxID=340221 RepID=A0A917MJX5_9HYPH|nr:hypothetical protein GCM10007036_23920 [Alsobacter metallidurans]
MERDDGEQLGAVLVLDRDRLNARYRLHQFDYWGDRSEAEERIYRRDVDQLGRYLVGIFFRQNSPVADRPDVLDRSEAIAVRAICKRERMGELNGAEQIDEAYNEMSRDDDGEWFASRPGRRLCLQSYYPGEHGLGAPTERCGAVLVTGVVDHGPNGRERLGLYQSCALHVPDTDRAIGFSFPKPAAARARVVNPGTCHRGKPLRLHRTPLTCIKAGCVGTVPLTEAAAAGICGAEHAPVAAQDREDWAALVRLTRHVVGRSTILMPAVA